VGAITLWPLFYAVLFVGLTITSVKYFWFPEQPAVLVAFRALHFGTMLLILGLTVFYLAFLFTSDRMPLYMKVAWVPALILASFVAMPLFFYLYVRPEGHRPRLEPV
jgi:hypothetical protein